MGTENTQLRQAWDFIENTGRSVFLTGKAGTGKTTFLKTVVRKSSKQTIVLAPTGVAAINAGGVTIHSFFQLPLSPYLPGTSVKTMFSFGKEKRKIISSLDMIIIDEISMVRCDLLDAMDAVLRHFRDWRKPFGGVQLLMIGDLAQLTPVVTPEDEAVLGNTYSTPYFFGSKALAKVDYVTIQLEKIYRQQDTTFVELLNRVREGNLSAAELARLNERFIPSFTPKAEDGYIRLTTHNRMAEHLNDTELARLPGRSFTYDAEITGNFPEISFPTSRQLTLKVGAQVMFVRNDPTSAHQYYNGMIGRVVYADDSEIRVLGTGQTEAIVVEKQEWENERYTVNDKTKEIETEVLGVFKQYPLRLAWAVTIHKSQGLTFDRAIIDAGRSFAPGQVYVALSRCRTLEGLVLSSQIGQGAIIGDAVVDNYMAAQQQQAERSIAVLPDLKDEYHRALLYELFDFSNILRLEEAVLRILVEYFPASFSDLASCHRVALDDLRKKIVDVSLKWQHAMALMSTDQLHGDAFIERAQRSADYFSENLIAVLTRPLSLALAARTDNKYAQKRMQETGGDLKTAWRTKVLLLQSMSDKPFSTAVYLDEKRKAVMDAIDEGKGKPSGNRQRERKPKQPKAPVEKTWEKSYRLFREGNDIDTIASERSLTRSTILSHLARYVRDGILHISDIIDEEKRLIICRCVEKVQQECKDKGEPVTTSAIKAACPGNVTYEDIRLVMECCDI